MWLGVLLFVLLDVRVFFLNCVVRVYKDVCGVLLDMRVCYFLLTTTKAS